MKKEYLLMILVNLGMILITAGVILPFFIGPEALLYKCLYSAGAIMLLIGRVLEHYEGKNLRLKRLFRIETWAALFFCVGAVLMFYPPGNNLRDVLAFTVAGGAIQIFTSIMIPIQLKKEGKDD